MFLEQGKDKIFMLTELNPRVFGKEPELNHCALMQILFLDVTKYLSCWWTPQIHQPIYISSNLIRVLCLEESCRQHKWLNSLCLFGTTNATLLKPFSLLFSYTRILNKLFPYEIWFSNIWNESTLFYRCTLKTKQYKGKV